MLPIDEACVALAAVEPACDRNSIEFRPTLLDTNTWHSRQTFAGRVNGYLIQR